MGSLTSTPLSEVMATLEILERHGVRQEDLKKVRAAHPDTQRHIAQIIRNATSLTSISTTSKDKAPTPLLRFKEVVNIEAIPGFQASENFKDNRQSPTVKICYLLGLFKSNFLRKEEGFEEAAEIKLQLLKQDSVDPEIIEELGAAQAEITLGQFFALLTKQGGGEQGPLLIDGRANLAYVRDGDNILRALKAYWDSERKGWMILGCRLENEKEWSSGTQVLSS